MLIIRVEDERKQESGFFLDFTYLVPYLCSVGPRKRRCLRWLIPSPLPARGNTMAKVTQVGPGRKTKGTIDGITYVTRNGETYVRSAPTMPKSVYNTPAAKKRQAIFKMVQMHMKYHLHTIKQTFTPKGNGTASNRYYSLNGKALTAALDTLADLYIEGQDVTIADIEQAISDYATENPQAIIIASLSGYNEVFLTGEWPATITLNARAGGDSTVIIIVNEYGVTTTINADGTTTVTQNSGSQSNSGSGNGGTENTGGTENNGGTGGGEDTGNTGGGDNSGGTGDGPSGLGG